MQSISKIPAEQECLLPIDSEISVGECVTKNTWEAMEQCEYSSVHNETTICNAMVMNQTRTLPDF